MVMKTKLIISVLAFLAITTLASGQNNGINSPPRIGTGKVIAYVDANNNGICDNYEKRTSDIYSCNRSGDINCCGICQRYGQKGCCQRQGSGRNYIDENKNGVCDRKDTPAKK